MGTWSMDIIGATVTVTRDDKVYRQGELGAKGGVLTIQPNGTYTWQAYNKDTPSQLIRGTWRKATPTEMRYQGGDSIVLLKAKSGWDWVVCQDRQQPVASGYGSRKSSHARCVSSEPVPSADRLSSSSQKL